MLITNNTYLERKARYYPNVTDEQWNDWHWQVKNRITDAAGLRKYIPLTQQDEQDIAAVLERFRIAITPYYLTLIDPDDPEDPVKLQAIPSVEETYIGANDMNDPLDEDKDSPVPGLTHRYPDRVLFLVTDMCGMYCRHCTRRRFAGQKDSESPTERVQRGIDYIRSNPQVRDVLLSGGDVLLLSDKRLEWIISELRKIEHVEIIRLGSRTPVVIPTHHRQPGQHAQKYHPSGSTHFNHTTRSRARCRQAGRRGHPGQPERARRERLREHQRTLVTRLTPCACAPTVYQCDLSAGIEHFRAHLKGIEIVEGLRAHVGLLRARS